MELFRSYLAWTAKHKVIEKERQDDSKEMKGGNLNTAKLAIKTEVKLDEMQKNCPLIIEVPEQSENITALVED